MVDGEAIYPPPDGDVCHKPPVTSIRWELLRQGLEDVEYLYMLDRMAGATDAAHECGYEVAVLRGGSNAELQSARPLTECCGVVADAKKALDAVDSVTWGLTSERVTISSTTENYVQHDDEPFTLDPAVLHQVLAGVARAIEGLQRLC